MPSEANSPEHCVGGEKDNANNRRERTSLEFWDFSHIHSCAEHTSPAACTWVYPHIGLRLELIMHNAPCPVVEEHWVPKRCQRLWFSPQGSFESSQGLIKKRTQPRLARKKCTSTDPPLCKILLTKYLTFFLAIDPSLKSFGRSCRHTKPKLHSWPSGNG